MYDIESAAKALRQLKAFEKQRAKQRQKVLENFDARWEAKRNKVIRNLDPATRDAVLANLAESWTEHAPDDPAPESTDRPAWLDEQPEPAPKPQVIDRGGKGGK